MSSFNVHVKSGFSIEKARGTGKKFILFVSLSAGFLTDEKRFQIPTWK